MTQNTVDKQLAERIQKLLTEAHKCDPSALQSLLSVRVDCNDKLRDHPTIQISNNTVGLLGILNGLCGADDEGRGPVRALYAHGVLIGFDAFGAVGKPLPGTVGNPAAADAKGGCSDEELTADDARRLPSPITHSIEMDMAISRTKHAGASKAQRARLMLSDAREALQSLCQRDIIGMGYTAFLGDCLTDTDDDVISIRYRDNEDLRWHHVKITTTPSARELVNYAQQQFTQVCGDLLGAATGIKPCAPESTKPAIKINPSYKAFSRDIHSEVQLRSMERFSDDYAGIMEGIIVDMVRKGLVHPTDWTVWLSGANRVSASYVDTQGNQFDHRGSGRWTKARRSREAWEIVVQYVVAKAIQDLTGKTMGSTTLKTALSLANASLENLVARGDIRNYKVSVHQHRDVQPILLPSDCGDMKSSSVGSILTDIICEFDVGGMPVGLNGPILYKSIVRLQ